MNVVILVLFKFTHMTFINRINNECFYMPVIIEFCFVKRRLKGGYI